MASTLLTPPTLPAIDGESEWEAERRDKVSLAP